MTTSPKRLAPDWPESYFPTPERFFNKPSMRCHQSNQRIQTFRPFWSGFLWLLVLALCVDSALSAILPREESPGTIGLNTLARRSSYYADVSATGYISSQRGNISSQSCSYDSPCASFEQFLLLITRNGVPTTIEATFLSGQYHLFDNHSSLTTLTLLDTMLNIKVPTTQNPLHLSFSNVVIRPDKFSTIAHNSTLCAAIIEVPDTSCYSLSVSDATILAESSISSCLAVSVPLVEHSLGVFNISNVSIHSESPKHLVLDSDSGVPISNTFVLHNISTIINGVYAPFEMTAKITIGAPAFLSHLDVISLDIQHKGFHIPTNLSNPTVLVNVRVHAARHVWCRSSFSLSECLFENSAIQLIGPDCQLNDTIAGPMLAHSVTISQSTFVNSTLFVWSNEVEARFNRFYSSNQAEKGMYIPPLMLHYLAAPAPAASSFPGVIDAKYNFWASPSGPSTCCNPEGLGLPVLWGTDFRFWCLDETCATFSESTPSLDRVSISQDFGNFDQCFREMYCSTTSHRILWISFGIQSSLLVLGVIAAAILLRRKTYTSETERFKTTSMAVAIFIMLLSIAFICESVLMRFFTPSSNNLFWTLSSEITLAAMITLSNVSALVLIMCLAVLFVLFVRKNVNSRLRGLRPVFILILLLCLLCLYGGNLSQIIPSTARQIVFISSHSTNYAHAVLSPLLERGFLPTPYSWMPWSSATVMFFISLVSLAALLWQLLRIRDYEEVESAWSEIEIRSTLLGVRQSTLLTTQNAASGARRIGFAILCPLFFTIFSAVLMIEGLYNLNFTPMALVELSILLTGVCSCVYGMIVFFRFHFRVALCWLLVAIYLFESVAVFSLISLWVMWIVLYHPPQAPIFTFVVTSLAGVSYVGVGIAAAIFTRKMSATLAADMHENIKEHMEATYDPE